MTEEIQYPSTRFDNVVPGPALLLAARVAEALNNLQNYEERPWGTFYVKEVVIAYTDGDIQEIVGHLKPDEAEGDTFEFAVHSPYGEFLEAKYNYVAWKAEKGARDGVE